MLATIFKKTTKCVQMVVPCCSCQAHTTTNINSTNHAPHSTACRQRSIGAAKQLAIPNGNAFQECLTRASKQAANNLKDIMSMNRRPSMSDPYRDTEIPAELYETNSRYSDAESFRAPATGGRVDFPWRTLLVGLFLFALGTTFLVLGATHLWHKNRDAAIAFICIGSIAFIPGTYTMYALFHALRGTPGFQVERSMLLLFLLEILRC